jgi:sugar phosphate isomerase/epimerase
VAFRYAICNETWGDLPLAETCRRIAAAGYDGVEIAPFTLAKEWGKPADTLTPDERTAVRRAAEDARLAVVGLHWLLVPPPDGLHLTTDDAAVRHRTARYLEGLAHLCADLGGTILVLGSPKQRSLAPGTTRDEGLARLAEACLDCLSACEDRGVTLCLEPLGPQETNFVNTLREARRLCEAAGSPACRTIFDVKAAATEGPPLPDLIAANADLIAHVHANDVNRRGPGFGETEFPPILEALQTVDYHGWVSVEVFDYSPDPDTIARVSLQTLRAAEAAAGQE